MKLTQKQEKFALNIFEGMTQEKAYIQAGYSKNTPATVQAHACRLAKNGKVLARLEELRAKAESDKILSVTQRKEILSEIARARQTDFMTCSADGVWMHDIGPESMNKAGLKQIQTTTMPFGDKESPSQVILTKVELHNPMQAIDLLNKMDKIYSPDGGVTINDIKILVVYDRSDKRGQGPSEGHEQPLLTEPDSN